MLGRRAPAACRSLFPCTPAAAAGGTLLPAPEGRGEGGCPALLPCPPAAAGMSPHAAGVLAMLAKARPSFTFFFPSGRDPFAHSPVLRALCLALGLCDGSKPG